MMLLDTTRRPAATPAGIPSALPIDHDQRRFRPLAHGEVESVREVFDGMSTRSRYLRFLTPVPRLTGTMQRALADVDQVRHIAWVAHLDGHPVGIGRYVLLPGQPRTAEVALAVADAHQNRGIGRRLLDILLAVAAGNGVDWFTFNVHPDNRAALALLRTTRAVGRCSDGLVEFVLAVPTPADPADPRAPARWAGPTG